MYPRHAQSLLQERFKQSRSVFLCGARQVGKTTLAKLALPALPLISLENPEERLLASEDPKSFLDRFPKGAILDEIQRVPELLSWIQERIDHQKIKYVMTGSQNILLHQEISVLQLPPLSQAEISKRSLPSPLEILTGKDAIPAKGELWSAVLRGGYPEPCAHPKRAKSWHGDYIQTYLERDVRQILRVRDLGTFQRFLALCAGRTGQVLNHASLSGDCGVSETTVRQWLSVLESSGIIHFLKPYHRNFNKQVIKSPKLYFCDTGIACYLLGIRDAKVLSLHPLAGSLFETWAIQELRKHWFNRGEQPPLFWWRDNHGLEIDLLVDIQGELWPIEIKSGKTLATDLWKNLIQWCSVAGLQSPRGSLIYGGKESLQVKGIQMIPWNVL